MLKHQQQVAEFMLAAGQDIRLTPGFPADSDQSRLGIRLIEEELDELRQAIYIRKNLIEMYDALLDLAYVIYWNANCYGVELHNKQYHANNNTHLWSPEMAAEYIGYMEAAIKGLHEAVFRDSDIYAVANRLFELLNNVLCLIVGAGLNYSAGLDEVHRSNMTKFIDGHRDAGGKWIKGPSYSPANLEPVIAIKFIEDKNVQTYAG